MLDTNLLQTKTCQTLIKLIEKSLEYIPEESSLKFNCRKVITAHKRAIDKYNKRIGKKENECQKKSI
tara:strand:+ start:1444 stop:1644 length:201 start_codon:yes stop_codon:yes gene_type:complete